MSSGIYSITHPASGRRYVGSSVVMAQRWRQHRSQLRRGIHFNAKLQRAWTKYGEDSFTFDVVEAVPEANLMQREQHWICQLNCVSSGFNIAALAGRERAGTRHTPESILLMSVAQSGKVISREAREKLSKALKGRQFTEETRARISAAKTGKKRAPFTDKALANMRAAAKTRPPKSPEHRLALSLSHKRRAAL